MAHYGRYFSYDERKYPIWWYDYKAESRIFVEDLLRKCNIDDASKIDYEALKCEGFIPFFQLDILSLELEYADFKFDANENKILQSLGKEEFYYSFMRTIDLKRMRKDWYFNELNALSKEAENWAKENGISYDKE